MTNFYVLTPEAVLFAEEWDEEIENGKSSFRTVFSAGQDIITAYRTLPNTSSR